MFLFLVWQSHFKDFILTDNCSTDFLKKKVYTGYSLHYYNSKIWKISKSINK